MWAPLPGLGPLPSVVECRPHGVLEFVVGRIAGRTPLPAYPPDTQRQRLDLGSGHEDLDQSCLGLGGGAERQAGAVLAGPGVPQGG